jgi:hypothetical protein
MVKYFHQHLMSKNISLVEVVSESCIVDSLFHFPIAIAIFSFDRRLICKRTIPVTICFHVKILTRNLMLCSQNFTCENCLSRQQVISFCLCDAFECTFSFTLCFSIPCEEK